MPVAEPLPSLSAEQVRELWDRVARELAGHHPGTLRLLLDEVRPVGFHRRTLYVAVRSRAASDALRGETATLDAERALHRVTGIPCAFACIHAETDGSDHQPEHVWTVSGGELQRVRAWAVPDYLAAGDAQVYYASALGRSLILGETAFHDKASAIVAEVARLRELAWDLERRARDLLALG